METHRFATPFAVGLGLAFTASVAAAQVAPLPSGYRVQEVPPNGTSLHVRIG